MTTPSGPSGSNGMPGELPPTVPLPGAGTARPQRAASPSGSVPLQPLEPAAGSVAARVLAGVAGIAAAVLVWVVWRYFVGTYDGQRADWAAFEGATYGQGRLWRVAEPVLDVVSISFVVLGVGAAMGIALVRRRWALAIQVAFLVAGANVTTQLLKHVVLDRTNLLGTWDSGNTLPSGHTTVAASVAVALLLVVPRRGRPLTALLGAGYTAATGVSTLVGQWHRPSDVIAAVLVVLAWTGIVLAFTPASGLDRVSPSEPTVGAGSWTTAVLLWVGGGAALAGAGLALERVLAAAPWQEPQTVAYVGGAFGVIGCTAVAFGLMLVLRQATGHPGAAAQVARHQ
ncbi:phosphatase PAP2 family protein [Paraoerskovia marina]|nr:phosphatase PAP2 family protein [Paraoerskovia marina]